MPIAVTLFLMKMALRKNMTEIIFCDTDFLSSFLWTNTEFLLIHLFGSNMFLPRQVYDELSKVPPLKIRVDQMIKDKYLSIIDIEVYSEEESLYNELTFPNQKRGFPLIGKGEAAAIVLSKKNKGTLASNNLKDVLYYVHLYDLIHITTADIIKAACEKDKITVNEAEEI